MQNFNKKLKKIIYKNYQNNIYHNKNKMIQF